jgi:Fe-S-cluster-containing dehydrogenase component
VTQLALIADLDRCTGCQSCAVACKQERRLPAGVSFIRLTQVGPVGEFPDLTMYYLPVACQQCRQPACAASCPEDAISRAKDGVVTVSDERCTACGACVAACPYGAITLSSAQSWARKCDLCSDLRAAGRVPACVACCPAKALAVVDVEGGRRPGGRGTDEHGRASFAFMPSRGTDPAGRFILSRQEWRDFG